ncbi:MAG: hypothetical protein J7642_19745 [Cyanobacteria bacterium SBC]|nr:hypothetical protein [Cyanobacteria bacterium SBC]
MGNRLKNWQFGILLVALAAFAIAPMLERNYPINHSTHFNLSWAFQYQRQFFSGQLYPRWLEFSNFGFGNATFVFYPPLSMVATLPFRMLGLGLPASLIGSMALAISVLGWGLYRYARSIYPVWVSAVVSAVGMMSPYFLVDIYQRGSLGEVWAIAVLPWILFASQQSIDRVSIELPTTSSWRQRLARWGLEPDRDLLALGIAYGALVLSHLPTLLVFTSVWWLLPGWVGKPESRWKACLRCYAGAALGLMGTAFFLLPVLFDGGAVQLDRLYVSEDYFPQNRLILSGLWQLKPDITNHWFDRTLWKPWLVMAWVTLGSIVGYSLEKTDGRRRNLATYWTFASLVALLMTTDLLGWLYSWIPPLQRIQFSWRWLGIATVCVPLTLGDWLLRTATADSPQTWRRGVMGAVSGLLWLTVVWHGFQGMLVAEGTTYQPETIEQFARLARAKRFPEEPHLPPAQPFLHWHWIYTDGLAFVDVWEYRAIGLELPLPPDRIYPLVEWRDRGRDGLDVERWDFGIRQIIAENPTSGDRLLRLRTFDYPSWFVRLDRGAWRRVDRSIDGRIQVSVPPGSHQVTVSYRGTPAERLGLAISLVTWIAVGSGSVSFAKRMARSIALRNSRSRES